MSIYLTSTGDNSAMIEFSAMMENVEYNLETDFFPLIQQFLTNHGWTFVSDEILFGCDAGKIFSSLNKDGTTTKYFYLGSKVSGNVLVIEPFESWDGSVTTNSVYKDHDYSYDQYIYPGRNSGKLRLFATDKWFYMFMDGDVYKGTAEGSAFTGCVEVEKFHTEDTTPSHVFVEARALSGNATATFDYVFSPCRTYRSVGVAASMYTRITTPMGAWGRGGYDSVEDQSNIINRYPIPVFIDPKLNILELNLVTDVGYPEMMVKGKLFGLKLIGYYVASTGDKITVKCDTDLNLDDSGLDKDFFIISDSSRICWALPL